MCTGGLWASREGLAWLTILVVVEAGEESPGECVFVEV